MFGVERLECRLGDAIATLVSSLCLEFLDPPGVGEHVFQDVGGLVGAKYRSLVALCHQFGQQATMIDMGVGEDDGVNGVRRERESPVVQRLEAA